MPKKYDLVVFIGRFQPFHNGHYEVLKKAKELAETVLVLVGSSYKPRTFKNPFLFAERAKMISDSIESNKVIVLPLQDNLYNDEAWVVDVQRNVTMFNDKKIAIIGHTKDESSQYLKWFPQWDVIDHELVEPLDSTQIRDFYFKENSNLNFIKSVVPVSTFKFLESFKKNINFDKIVREKQFLEKHNKVYAQLPYPPTFQTADSVVVQSGHVLLIKRRAEPGKGLYALPGGYLNAKTDKSIFDAAIRELIEETGIKVPEKVLRGSVKESKVFDAIGRSERGRIITQAFKIELSGTELPKVKGSDDAEKAVWFPISSISSEEMFEDHYDILKYFLGI